MTHTIENEFIADKILLTANVPSGSPHSVREHTNNVRLRKADLEGGNMESTERRMDNEDVRLASYSTKCPSSIDWKHSKIVGKKKNTELKLTHKTRWNSGSSQCFHP